MILRTSTQIKIGRLKGTIKIAVMALNSLETNIPLSEINWELGERMDIFMMSGVLLRIHLPGLSKTLLCRELLLVSLEELWLTEALPSTIAIIHQMIQMVLAMMMRQNLLFSNLGTKMLLTF
jgi:hypothetical protein